MGVNMKSNIYIDTETSVIMLLTGYSILSVLFFNAMYNVIIFLNTFYNSMKCENRYTI